jgi:hypothetical protein
MDQRSICLFLAFKRVSAWAVSYELTVVLGPDAIASSIATKYLRQRQFTLILVDPSPEEPATIVIEQANLDTPARYSFSSIRELARLTCIETTMLHRH